MRKRWEQTENTKNFIRDVIELFNKYGVSISHEDDQGSFIIKDIDTENIRWFSEALDLTKNKEEETGNDNERAG